MAYQPQDRKKIMEAMKKNIDSMVLMCDDGQDLVALASIMAVTAKNLLVQQVGRSGAIAALKKIIEVI